MGARHGGRYVSSSREAVVGVRESSFGCQTHTNEQSSPILAGSFATGWHFVSSHFVITFGIGPSKTHFSSAPQSWHQMSQLPFSTDPQRSYQHPLKLARWSKCKGRNLRAGEASRWTGDFFHGHGLYRLCGTVKYPEAA